MVYLTAVSFAIGILLGNFFDFGSTVSLFLILVSLSLFFVLRNKKEANKILFCIIFIAVGILKFNFSDIAPDSELVKLVGRTVSLSGEISEERDERDTSSRYILKIDNSESRTLVVADRFPKFEYGDRVSVSGRLELPKNFSNENGMEFDYISYLAKDRVHFVIYRPEIEKVGTGGNFIFKNLYKTKNYFIEKVEQVVPEPNSSLVNGLIFGARASLGQKILDTMKNVGLIHIVAISGYNVTIIAVAILYFAAHTGRQNLGLLLSAFIIFLFALMVGFGSTVIRASVMAGIAILAKYLGRPNDALRALFVAGFLMLLFNPLVLTSDPSFQLSFMATLGLLLFSPIVENFMFDSRFKKFFSLIPNKLGLREIASSTFAVQIFLLPMLIKMSGIISPISFVLNLLVLPLIPWAMLLGFLTAITGLISNFASWPFGALTYVLTEIILRLAGLAEKIPLGFIEVGSLSNFSIVLIYIFYAWAFWKFSSTASQLRLEKKSSM